MEKFEKDYFIQIMQKQAEGKNLCESEIDYLIKYNSKFKTENPQSNRSSLTLNCSPVLEGILRCMH